MFVEKVMPYSKEKIFEKIKKSLIVEVNNFCKNVESSKIKKGFKYKKELKPSIGKKVVVNVEILELDESNFYKVSFSTLQSINYISYKLEEISENETKVILEETSEMKNFFDRLNYNVLTFLLSRKIKKQSLFRLEQLEKILENDK